MLKIKRTIKPFGKKKKKENQILINQIFIKLLWINLGVFLTKK